MEAIFEEGIVEIIRIENQGGTDQKNSLTANFVRYPRSQQLTVWLPENAWNGYGRYKITEQTEPGTSYTLINWKKI